VFSQRAHKISIAFHVPTAHNLYGPSLVRQNSSRTRDLGDSVKPGLLPPRYSAGPIRAATPPDRSRRIDSPRLIVSLAAVLATRFSSSHVPAKG